MEISVMDSCCQISKWSCFSSHTQWWMLSARPRAIQASLHCPPPWKWALSSEERKQPSLWCQHGHSRRAQVSAALKGGPGITVLVAFSQVGNFHSHQNRRRQKKFIRKCVAISQTDRRRHVAIHLLLLSLTATDCMLSLTGLIHTFCRCIVERKNFGHFSSYHGNKVPRYGKKFPGSTKNISPYSSKYLLVT